MDLSYYKNISDNCLKQIKVLEKYVDNANKTVLKFETIKNLFKSCYQNYASGGYIDNGITLDKGVLVEEINYLEMSITSLNDTIYKASNEIEQYRIEYNKNIRIYNELKNNK